MYSLIIRRPQLTDLPELDVFFERMIPLSYAENGIVGFDEDMAIEIGVKKAKIRGDLASDGQDYHFLLAECEGCIVGTIAFGPTNELLNKTSGGRTRELKEIGCLLILREYQGQGIGMQLVCAILHALAAQGHARCCLDCGYKKAQQMWLRKLGSPHYCLENYWENGIDHFAWDFSLAEMLTRLT